MQRADPALAVIGLGQRLAMWLVWYGIALAGFLVFLLGDIPFAVLLIITGELLLLFTRPQPKLGVSAYAAPVPAGWQGPITALRWTLLIGGCWSTVTTALSITLVFAITAAVAAFVFFFWPHTFGAANVVVLVLLTAWLSTRPLWIEPLRKSLKRDVNTALASYLPYTFVNADGLEIEVRFIVIGTPPQRYWHLSVPFSDLEEVRLLDGLSAQGYLESLQAYDPTIPVRLQWEIWQFYMGRQPKPSIFTAGPAAGAQLLLRGPTLLYLIANADQTGPAAVAAFQAWRAAHPTPSVPTA